MTRQEFLEELKNALTGEVSPEVMMDSYRYYSTYFDDEIRKGRSEEEILEELGRPNLIARSIIAAQTGEREADVEYTEDGRTRKVRKNPFNKTEFQEKADTTSKENTHREFVFDFNAWYAKVLLVLFIVLLFLLVFFIIKVGVWVLVTFGIPILLILGIIYLIMYFLR